MSTQLSVQSADGELEMEGARNYTKWHKNNVIISHSQWPDLWLRGRLFFTTVDHVVVDVQHLVWGPALIVFQCLGHVKDLTNHLLAFNTSERLSSPPHSFTHTWWWYWGLHIIREITNTICNNCRPLHCDTDKEKLERWLLCLWFEQQDAPWGRPSVARVQVSFLCT